MKKRLLLLAAAFIVAMTGSSRLSANSGPNGTDPRPFYVMAHNPNTLDMVALALQSGANALEPDIMVLPDGARGLPAFQLDPTGMVMYHDSSALTARVPLSEPNEYKRAETTAMRSALARLAVSRFVDESHRCASGEWCRRLAGRKPCRDLRPALSRYA